MKSYAESLVRVLLVDDDSEDAAITSHLLKTAGIATLTTKDQGKGSGLGLSTVYGIVKQLDAYITLESTLGAGTIISIYLPVSTDEVVAAAVAAVDDVVRSVANERILVVEDSPHIRSVVRRSLKAQGYTVAVADNGATALATLEQIARRVREVLNTSRRFKAPAAT
jgi:two-component system cell cycle sensor histidine kinase/response regulator CckA